MKKTKIVKLSKIYNDFNEGIRDVLYCKPQLTNIILPEEFRDNDTVISMEDFYNNFPNIISGKNPIAVDEKGNKVNKNWEYHLSPYKFHIKTSLFFAVGMYYKEDKENGSTYNFYISLFGNSDIDKEFLVGNGWEVIEEVM